MNPLLLYTEKVILCSSVLLGYYWLALRNKTFHQWNRFYLLISIVLSLVVPVLKINVERTDIIPSGKVFHILNAITTTGNVEVESHTNSRFALTKEQWLLLLYVFVSSVLVSIIVVSSVRIYRILHAYPKKKIGSIFFLNTTAKGTPFTFFNYIVWNQAIDLDTETGRRVFQHELVHVQQRHTWDKLFLLLLLIPFWCNPCFWLIRKELAALHEFAADEKAIAQNDAGALAQLILNTTFPQQQFFITNHLFQSTIKRRIAMFTKIQNPKVNYWSRLAALPVLLIVIASFALKTRLVHESVAVALDKPITVVIDAGHGGKDGVRWKNIYEDDIALAISKKIKEQNSNKNVHIILTRQEDEKLDLHKRVDIASETKADLFISLHVNAAEAMNESGQLTENPANGIEIFVPSKAPRYQQQSEAIGTMLVQALSSAYTTSMELKKYKTRIWVIDNNVCPSVLAECGYITSEKDRDFMTQEANQSVIANKILDAVEQYAVLKNSNETSFATDTVPGRMYQNKAVTDVQYFEYPKQEVHLSFADGSKDTISYTAAKAANLFDQKAITQIEERPWDNEKVTEPNLATGDLIVRKASIEEARNFKGRIMLNMKIFKGTFQQLPITVSEIAFISIIKGTAFQELGVKPGDSILNISTKAFIKATTQSDGHVDNEPLFTAPEVTARFPEQNGGWTDFLIKNLNGAVPASKGAKSGTYKVVVGFIVDPQGKLYDLKPLTHYGYGMEDEVLRILRLSPDWLPAQQNGQMVTTYIKQPVTFVVSKS